MDGAPQHRKGWLRRPSEAVPPKAEWKDPGDEQKASGTARKGRISPQMREAIRLRVIDDLTLDQAAERAGVSVAGICKALKQPHVIAFAEQVQWQYIQDVTARRSFLKAKALKVAEELLTKAQSEQVRARMVEFLSGEGRQPLVNVQVSAAERGVYAYTKPRDITPPPDSASGGLIGQAVEIEGKSQEPDQHD